MGDSSLQLKSVERLDISSNKLVTWTQYATGLIYPAINARAVTIDDYIYVVPGYGKGQTQIIDALTADTTQITVMPGHDLYNAVNASSVIKVDGVIYSFGDTKLETLYVIFYFYQYTPQISIYFYFQSI